MKNRYIPFGYQIQNGDRHQTAKRTDIIIRKSTILTARIIEKVIVHSRQEIEIYFIGGYTQKIDLI